LTQDEKLGSKVTWKEKKNGTRHDVKGGGSRCTSSRFGGEEKRGIHVLVITVLGGEFTFGNKRKSDDMPNRNGD